MLGKRIRERRHELGSDPRRLSRRSGFAGFLSQLDHDLGSPSFASLQRAATILQIPIFHLFDGYACINPVIRAHECRKAFLRDARVGYESLTAGLRDKTMPIHQLPYCVISHRERLPGQATTVGSTVGLEAYGAWAGERSAIQ